MKVLGIETENVTIFGKFTFTNTTDFPIVVSLWQTSPLYYRVLQPEQTWNTGSIGAVWFTVKVLLAGQIVGFAALGAIGLGATALGATFGVGRLNPDWEAWLEHNNFKDTLSNEENQKGIASIKHCEFSEAGHFAGKHPHLYISGGPAVQYNKSQYGTETVLLWREFRVGKVRIESEDIPVIRPKLSDFGKKANQSPEQFKPVPQKIVMERQDGGGSDDSEDEDAPMLSRGRGR